MLVWTSKFRFIHWGSPLFDSYWNQWSLNGKFCPFDQIESFCPFFCCCWLLIKILLFYHQKYFRIFFFIINIITMINIRFNVFKLTGKNWLKMWKQNRFQQQVAHWESVSLVGSVVWPTDWFEKWWSMNHWTIFLPSSSHINHHASVFICFVCNILNRRTEHRSIFFLILILSTCHLFLLWSYFQNSTCIDFGSLAKHNLGES